MNVILAGPDEYDIAEAIDSAGHDVERLDIADRPSLEDANVADADVFVLTEMEQATTIAVAKDCNPAVRVVVYADGSLPDFARAQADLLIDPALLDPAAVAEELDATD